MPKIKLSNKIELETLLEGLRADSGTDITFVDKEPPIHYPCMAVYFYMEDIDFGNSYNMEFVYPSDFII